MTPGLLTIALGGNALSPPAGDPSIAAERSRVEQSVAELGALARAGHRLLVIHGNGPQVGRLLAAQAAEEQLDVAVAQTQGELGYLLAEALDQQLGAGSTVALVTRVLVDPADPAFRCPTKPIGPVLPSRPSIVPARPMPDGQGWRRVVASPRPRAVQELAAIRTLLPKHHVVAGGGGGIPISDDAGRRMACPAVVDKDWVAAMLAIALDAACLVFVTDVAHAIDGFGGSAAAPISRMRVGEARRRLTAGVFAPGSMGPKVESAVEFVEATGRHAVIAGLGQLETSLCGAGGTTVTP